MFAETEVISLISKRNSPAGIAAGIHAAVAKRVFSLVRRVGVRPKLTVTGGCAKSRGLLKTLAEVLRHDIAPWPWIPSSWAPSARLSSHGAGWMATS